MESGFEWDERKAAANLGKHGVSFEQAALAFYDPDALFWSDPRHSRRAEEREICIGMTEDGILLVVFTERIAGSIRIISARRANKKERAYYHEEHD